jgi:hypothetical protein
MLLLGMRGFCRFNLEDISHYLLPPNLIMVAP